MQMRLSEATRVSHEATEFVDRLWIIQCYCSFEAIIPLQIWSWNIHNRLRAIFTLEIRPGSHLLPTRLHIAAENKELGECGLFTFQCTLPLKLFCVTRLINRLVKRDQKLKGELIKAPNRFWIIRIAILGFSSCAKNLAVKRQGFRKCGHLR